MPRPVILLTGFGPFPGVETNASSRLVARAAKAARRRFSSCRVRVDILPTEWERAPQRLTEIDATVKPAIAMHFGVSSEATGFVLEARGLNHCRQSLDATGAMPAAQHVIVGSAAEIPASLAIDRAAAKLRAAGLPVEISDDAGGYLCNCLLYHSLHLSREQAPRRIVGFVHIPSQLYEEEGRGLTWIQAEFGALEILSVAIEQYREGRAPQSR